MSKTMIHQVMTEPKYLRFGIIRKPMGTSGTIRKLP